MFKFLNYLFPLSLLILLPVHAAENPLFEKLNEINANPQLQKAAYNAGKDRAFLCKYCHGVDGNSVKGSIPNLAAQNPAYLIQQFHLFLKKKRISKTMNEIVKNLTPDDMLNIAVYYSEQQVKPQKPYKPDLLSQGKELFEARCFTCHGKDAYGKEELPRIASQPSEYIITTLSSYNSALEKRAESAMSKIARTLGDKDIEAVAAYLTSLK